MYFVVYAIFYKKDYNPNKINVTIEYGILPFFNSKEKKSYSSHMDKSNLKNGESVRFITVRIALKITWMQDNLLYCSIMVLSTSETSLKPPWIKKRGLYSMGWLVSFLFLIHEIFIMSNFHVSSIKVIQHSQSREQTTSHPSVRAWHQDHESHQEPIFVFQTSEHLKYKTTELRGVSLKSRQ